MLDTHSQLSLADIPDQDSIGTRWIHINDLRSDWCSPLVWEAARYILTKHIPSTVKMYETWSVLHVPLYPVENKNNRTEAAVLSNNKMN